MSDRHARLSLKLSRPQSNVRIVFVLSNACDHWSASLPLPNRVKIRVRHQVLGLVLPEQEVLSYTAMPPNSGDVATAFDRYLRSKSESLGENARLRDAMKELGLPTDSQQARAILLQCTCCARTLSCQLLRGCFNVPVSVYLTRVCR